MPANAIVGNTVYRPGSCRSESLCSSFCTSELPTTARRGLRTLLKRSQVTEELQESCVEGAVQEVVGAESVGALQRAHGDSHDED